MKMNQPKTTRGKSHTEIESAKLVAPTHSPRPSRHFVYRALNPRLCQQHPRPILLRMIKISAFRGARADCIHILV